MTFELRVRRLVSVGAVLAAGLIGLAWSTSNQLSNGTIAAVAGPSVSSLTPLNPTVECSGSVTFTVVAGGQAPLSYQWSVNAAPITGQTGTNFTLENIRLPGPVTVSVTVSNLSGAITSNSVITVQDTTAPVITLIGPNPMTVQCFSKFTDPGATANDACEGPVPVFAIGTVNTSSPGAYKITYLASDSSGNNSTNTRTVTVVAPAPPTVSNAAMMTDGSFSLNLNGQVGQPYRIQATTNLADPGSWTVIMSGTFGVGPSVFSDTNVTSNPTRYYRLVSP